MTNSDMFSIPRPVQYILAVPKDDKSVTLKVYVDANTILKKHHVKSVFESMGKAGVWSTLHYCVIESDGIPRVKLTYRNM